ncbi:MAG: hypothetical protein P4N41_01500 [Negativicutes bacterium]|nr:hypothetical protein [Negativicutes bacterium]
MRRFGVYGSGATAAELGVWLDTGFVEFQAGQAEEAAERPDVIFGRTGPDNSALSREIGLLLPKVIVLISPSPAEPPPDLGEEYRRHRWRQAGLDYLVATYLEPPLNEPEWAAYGGADSLKAVSDQIYRHLLADVLRETQEWCGHTFSVVHHC